MSTKIYNETKGRPRYIISRNLVEEDKKGDKKTNEE